MFNFYIHFSGFIFMVCFVLVVITPLKAYSSPFIKKKQKTPQIRSQIMTEYRAQELTRCIFWKTF